MSKHINKLELVPLMVKVYQYQKEYVDSKAVNEGENEHKLSNRKEMGRSAVIRELISEDMKKNV